MADDSLCVFIHGEPAGRLWLDEAGRFMFRYRESWTGPALSLSLPLQQEAFEPDQARAFFSNLLPEGGIRAAISLREGISADNDFALLEKLGGECAGAVSVWPDDRAQPVGSYRALTRQERDRLRARSGDPLLLPRGARMSLAGVHEKLPVFVDGDRILRPVGTASSTHILKAHDPRWHHLVENEALCMTLARSAGLHAAPVRLLAEYPALLVERFDRIRNAKDAIERVHQEDLCQALGLLPNQKYQAEGGPGFLECFEVFGRVGREPALDRRNLLRWAVFNLLVGNADAHAKNVSVLHREDGIVVAPFYDLVSTRLYDSLSDRPAMRYGGHDRFDVGGAHWRAFAEEAGLSTTLVADVIESFAEALPRLIAPALDAIEASRKVRVALRPIEVFVNRQCRRGSRAAAGLRRRGV